MDFDKLTETLHLLKIKFEVTNFDSIKELSNQIEYDKKTIKYNKIVKIDNGFGYFDFYTEFYFLDNIFKCHAIWE